MTFEIGRWLRDFPVREHCLYLDHAAVCPLPKPVAEAMRQRIADQENSGHEKEQEWQQHHLSCRHLGAQLIGCDPEDISIIRSTSEGLSLIAEGLTWEEGDEVLLGAEEFAANAAPWLHLERLGVRIIRIPQTDGRLDPQRVADHLSSRTRLLALSWVAFYSGWIAPLREIAKLCRNAGVLVVVDAIQGLGVLPMEMRRMAVDAVVADGHKWLLGPEGAGLMATTPQLRARLRPVISGWRNIERAPGSFFLEKVEHLGDGRRFEPGASNEIGIAGLAAALDLFSTVEFVNVTARVETMVRLLTRILIAHGWEVVSPGAGHPIAGIVAARHPGVTPRDATKRLRERRVITSERQGWVRFSPHFYTTRGEMEALDRILEKVGM